MSREKLVLNLWLRTLTPIHIGGASEKHLIRDIDFIAKGNDVFFLNEQALIHHFSEAKYCDALASNTLPDLLRSIDLKKYSSYNTQITGDPGQEIKRQVRTVLGQKPIIPGSSLKGAIRSVILNYLHRSSNRNNQNPKYIENDMFGKIHEDPMRFVQVNDINFEEVKMYNSKIFNLKKESNGWDSGWKHERQHNTTTAFNIDGFTTTFECIPANCIVPFRIVINLKAFQAAMKKQKVKSSEAINALFNSNFQSVFLNHLKDYAETYLKAEQAFINKYNAADYSADISDQFALLIQRNSQYPVLRLGAGSGFHSITGDWQFQGDHINTGQHSNNKPKYKSRRFTFEFDPASNTYTFAPMGFIQIFTDEQYRSTANQYLAEEEEKLKAETLKKQAELKLRAEQEKREREAAKQPVWRTLLQVKKEGIIDGEVVGKEGKQVLIKPFVEELKDQTLRIRYPAGFPIGTRVTVKASVQKKQVQLTFPIKAK